MSQDLCFRCNRITISYSQRGCGYTSFHCSECGAETDRTWDEDELDEAEFYQEYDKGTTP